MRKIFAVLLLSAAASAAAGADLVERVVARVDDAIITQSDLDARVERARKDPQAPTDLTKLRITVLEQMIRQKLVEGKAARLDIVATPEEIDEAMDRVKSQYGLTSDEEFDRALAANGIDRATLREQLRESLLTNKVLAREVPINLNDDALRTEYEKVKDEKYTIPEKARVAEILVRFDSSDPASKEAAKTKIDAARSQIAAGTPFADVAKTVTEGPARERGGDLGVVSRGDLTAALDQAIFGGTGTLAGPVELKDGWALLSVTDREKAGYRAFDDVKEEIRKRMSEEIYDKKFADYLVDLRKSAIVKIFDKDLAAEDEEARKKS